MRRRRHTDRSGGRPSHPRFAGGECRKGREVSSWARTIGHRGVIDRLPVLEELLAAKILVVRVLEPHLAQDFVAEIVSVLAPL